MCDANAKRISKLKGVSHIKLFVSHLEHETSLLSSILLFFFAGRK